MEIKPINAFSLWRKGLLMFMMRTFVFLLCTTVFALNPSDGFSQEKVNIDKNKEVSVNQIFRIIKKQTKYKFLYPENLFKDAPKVKLEKGSLELSELLKKALTSTNARFDISKNNTIIIKESEKPLKKGVVRQQIMVSGTVTDKDGTPLPGANIVEKGTTNGVQTNFDGNFSITTADENAILIISYIGFATQEVPLNGQSQLTVALEEDAAGLDEVVVIGYGTVKKSDLTGAVSSLSSEDLTNNVAANVTQQLTGRAPGVQIFQNSNEPGGGATIQIRGVGSINAGNQPLFVVDGLPISNEGAVQGGVAGSSNAPNPLNSINPGDIKSIEILKDASATAIYGSRGANGVIIITTKSGNRGKLKVGYQTRLSVSETYNRIELLNPQQYQTELNALIDAGAANASESERVLDIANGGTDWQDQIFQSAPTMEHTLSFSGGDENKTFFSSINYFNQDGLVTGSALERFALRLNLSAKTDKFKYGVNLTSSYLKQDIVPASPSPNDAGGVIGSAYEYDPTAPVFENEETGTYFDSPFLNLENPSALLNGRFVDGVTWRTLASVYGEYFLTPDLSAKLNLGTDIQNARRDVFLNDVTNAGRSSGGSGQVFTGNNFNYLAEATLNYNKVFNNKHSLNALAGVTTQKFFRNSANLGAQNFLSLSTETNNLQSGDPTQNTVTTSEVESSLLSYIGRVTYSFLDRYLLTGTVRVDGSSRFGENNKFATFPSMALGWKVHEESFMKDANIFDEFKLRASYGQTGNQDIGNFNSLTTIQASGVAVLPNGDQVNAAQPSRIANPDLRWETTTQTDIGFDWALKGRRLSGTIDYYTKNTTDLLFNVPIPSQTGFATVLTNIGEVNNSGFEFLLDAFILTGDFKWNASANFATIKNEVIDIGDADEIITGRGSGFTEDIGILRPGETMNSYYGWEVLGVWQLDDDFSNAPAGVVAGDWKYADLNDDGEITPDDRTIIGNSIPDFTWGLTNVFEYKGLTLSANLIGVHGVQLFNDNLRFTYFPINFRRNRIAEPILNRWTPDNPTNEYASFVNPISQGQNFINTRTVEDAGYVRLQNITLGYRVPMPDNSFLSSLNLSISADNLQTWTNYSGPDPGVNIIGNDTAGLRYDYGGYPLSRTFSLNLQAEF